MGCLKYVIVFLLGAVLIAGGAYLVLTGKVDLSKLPGFPTPDQTVVIDADGNITLSGPVSSLEDMISRSERYMKEGYVTDGTIQYVPSPVKGLSTASIYLTRGSN